MIRIFYVYMSDEGKILGDLKDSFDISVEIQSRDYCTQFNIVDCILRESRMNIYFDNVPYKPTLQHWMEI